MAPRRAQILFKDRLAGRLAETADGGSVFTYDADCRAAIACALPLDAPRVSWRGGLHPVFQNLGPEGWLRQQQARAGHLEGEDDFGLLLRYGADCIGALSVVPEDGSATEDDAAAPGAGPADAAADAASAASAASAAAGAHRTVSGVQPKLLAWQDGALFRPATDASPASHIAKYAPADRADLLRNELHSLALAAEILGPAEVTRFAPGRLEGIPGPALLVERFDRTAEGAKLRLEDFAQVLVRPRGADFRGKYQGSYEEIAAAIARHSARPAIDRGRFFAALVFGLLIGNADAHLKNWSLLERPEGLRLAPQYDLLNTLIYGGDYGRRTALAIGGDTVPIEAVDRPLVLAFAERIGLPARAAAQGLERLRRRFAGSRRLSPPAAEPPDGFLSRYAAIVRTACARILQP